MKLTCFVLIFLYCFLPLTFGSVKMREKLDGSNSTGVQQATSKKETQRTQSPVSTRSSGNENPSAQTNQKTVKPTSSQSGSQPNQNTLKSPISQSSSQANQKTATPTSSQSGSQANQKTGKQTSSQPSSQLTKSLAPSNKPSKLSDSLNSLKGKLPICSASSERIPTSTDFTYGSNFFKSIELMDLLKALKELADHNHGWAHPKVQSKRLAAAKILKKFRISEETKRLFNERPTDPLVKLPGRDLEKELHLICSQFAQMGKSKKLSYGGITQTPKQITATLGLTDVGSEVVEIGYCYNKVEPNVYIVLGPHVGKLKTFFLAIDFRDDDPNAREFHPTRRVLEHFYITKSGKPKRIFRDTSYLRSKIYTYKNVRDEINSENQRRPNPIPINSYFEGEKKENAKAGPATVKLFGSLSPKTQPDFPTAGIDLATLDELCEAIAAKGGYYYWKKSYEFYKDKEVYDTLYLFESRDKKDGIRRLGLCSYRMGDNIYVYLAKAERNHEEYLLAIKDKQLMVVVSNYQADISDEVVKFK